MLYEIRDVERLCKVYRVEAKSKEEALEKHGWLESDFVREFPMSGNGISLRVRGNDAA